MVLKHRRTLEVYQYFWWAPWKIQLRDEVGKALRGRSLEEVREKTELFAGYCCCVPLIARVAESTRARGNP